MLPEPVSRETLSNKASVAAAAAKVPIAAANKVKVKKTNDIKLNDIAHSEIGKTSSSTDDYKSSDGDDDDDVDDDDYYDFDDYYEDMLDSFKSKGGDKHFKLIKGTDYKVRLLYVYEPYVVALRR